MRGFSHKKKRQRYHSATISFLGSMARGMYMVSCLGPSFNEAKDQTRSVGERPNFLALPPIEWVDYRMGDARQRALYTDIGDPGAVGGV